MQQILIGGKWYTFEIVRWANGFVGWLLADGIEIAKEQGPDELTVYSLLRAHCSSVAA